MKCKYCGKEIIETSSNGFEICKCLDAQKEWSICMIIQEHQRGLVSAQKELKELKDKFKN